MAPFRSKILVDCTSLDSLRCVVYFYDRLRVICALRKHLESAEKLGVAMFTSIGLWCKPIR